MLHNIAEELAVNNSVVGTYQKLVKKCTNSKEQGVMNPRNKIQIKNLKNYIRAKKCISRDDIYNLYAMATKFDNFFWQIDLSPNLDAIIGLKDILDLFSDLLTVQSNELQLILAHDTTFQLGDFYVSPVLFQHLYFEGSPLIPLSILIHDQKYQLSHTKLFAKLVKTVPNLRKKRVSLIIEREKGIRNSTKTVSNLCPLLCWNHI